MDLRLLPDARVECLRKVDGEIDIMCSPTANAVWRCSELSAVALGRFMTGCHYFIAVEITNIARIKIIVDLTTNTGSAFVTGAQTDCQLVECVYRISRWSDEAHVGTVSGRRWFPV